MMKACTFSREGTRLYKSMLLEKDDVGGGVVDHYTHPILLHASGVRCDEIEGRMIHCHVIGMGFCLDVYVRNNLINMYCLCGNVRDARKVFDEITFALDSVSWNSILARYVRMGNVEEAKVIYDAMPEKNIIASNSMIVLFGRLGRVDEARRIFNVMRQTDIVSWSALVSCYEQNEMYEEALTTFKRMNYNGVIVDEVVGISALSACAHLFDLSLSLGKLAHLQELMPWEKKLKMATLLEEACKYAKFCRRRH